MEYVLMDIKNFLKKLENGQMEIEAGQWELHKTLESMSKTVGELSNLREDVADMKRSNLHQMGLIKDLQSKLDKINQTTEEDRPVTISESSVEYEGVFKRPFEGKGFKKRKCRIRSEEIIEITSQVSNEKSGSELGESSTSQNSPVIEEKGDKPDDNDKNSDGVLNRSVYKKDSYILPTHNNPSCHYPGHTSNDILQRYLKDSARYFENKKTTSSDVSFCSSKYWVPEESRSETEHPFWDQYSSRAPQDVSRDEDCSNSKENSSRGDKSAENSCAKNFSCSICSEKFTSKIDLLRHKKKHQTTKAMYHCSCCSKCFRSKLKLKEHEATHEVPSNSFKGFACCYCCKVCCTPEKLTEHVRKCRNIKKKYNE